MVVGGKIPQEVLDKLEKGYSEKEIIYTKVGDGAMGRVMAYLTNSKKIKREINGSKADLYLLEQGEMIYNVEEQGLTFTNLDRKTEKHLDGLLERQN